MIEVTATSAGSEDRLRRLIAAALVSGVVPADLAGRSVQAWMEVACWEGVLPWLEHRLRAGSGWEALPAQFRQALEAGSRAALVQELYRRHELQRVTAVLSQLGLQALVLKGNALGLWLYPKAHLRVTSDIDLLFATRQHADRACEAVSALGYTAEPDPGQLFFERKSKLVVNGRVRCELDLHSRLLNAPLYADMFSFEELWAAAIPLPGFGDAVKGLQVDHALMHACLNRALDIQTGTADSLKLLVDIDLLSKQMDAPAWNDFRALAHAKGVCGICARTLDDAVEMLHVSIPEAVRGSLRMHAASEQVDASRLADWRYMQWLNFKSLRGTRLRLQWLRERILPTSSRLRGRYGEGPLPLLMLRRLARGVALLFQRG